MKQFIAYLSLGAFLGMMPPPLFAQQNQSPQQLVQEIELLKNKVSKLEKQLRTVENVEKIELQAQLAEANAKLAEANAKLVNTEFEKFKRELRIDNEERMRSWSYWLFGILSFIAVASGTAVWFSLKSLIADRVEKSLDGFKKGLKELDILKNQLRESEKDRAVYLLEGIIDSNSIDEPRYPREIKALREEVLLQVFDDQTYDLRLRYKAAEVLAVSRKSPRLVSPMLEFLNSVVDLDIDYSETRLLDCVSLLGHIYTPETCKGLTKFLNRLLTENPRHRDLLIAETVLSLTDVSAKSDVRDSVPILKRVVPHLKNSPRKSEALDELARYFDIFNEPAGIKEILDYHGTSLPSEVVNECLELLERHDLAFVENWRVQHNTDNASS